MQGFKEMRDIIKIAKSLQDSGLLMKSVSQTMKNETKEQRQYFVGMLLGTLGSTLLGNMLASKGMI